MNIYFDFEMTGLHQATSPISLGMVTSSGRTFYAEFTDYDKRQLNNWLQMNVIRNLRLGDPRRTPVDNGELLGPDYEILGTYNQVRLVMLPWLSQFSDVTMVGDVLAYDWMLFCEMFPITNEDTAERLPANINYIPLDLATVFKVKGINPDVSRIEFAGYRSDAKQHNALFDAAVIRHCYELLMET